jgi:hypothetical protein
MFFRVQIGTQYTATKNTSEWARFRCVHCGYERSVLSVGRGFGTSFATVLEDGRGAIQASMSRAERRAYKACREAIAVAKCPLCSRRDGRARRKVVAGSIARGLGDGAIAASVYGAVVMKAFQPGAEVWTVQIAVCLVVVAIVAAWIRASRRLAPPFFQSEDDDSRRHVVPAWAGHGATE